MNVIKIKEIVNNTVGRLVADIYFQSRMEKPIQESKIIMNKTIVIKISS